MLYHLSILKEVNQKSQSFCMKTAGAKKRGGNALSKIAPFPAPCLCALKVGEAICTNVGKVSADAGSMCSEV